MFGIGMSEMLLILVIGLVVIGPKQLPEVARSLGKMFAQFKRTTNDLRDQVDREVKQFTEMEEVKEFKRSMEDEMTTMKTEAEDFLQKTKDEGERIAKIEDDAVQASPAIAVTGEGAAGGGATANSVEFSTTRPGAGSADDGGLPPGKLPS